MLAYDCQQLLLITAMFQDYLYIKYDLLPFIFIP